MLTCVLCGCTDDDCTPCVIRRGTPCYWISTNPPVCSHHTREEIATAIQLLEQIEVDCYRHGRSPLRLDRLPGGFRLMCCAPGERHAANTNDTVIPSAELRQHFTGDTVLDLFVAVADEERAAREIASRPPWIRSSN